MFKQQRLPAKVGVSRIEPLRCCTLKAAGRLAVTIGHLGDLEHWRDLASDTDELANIIKAAEQ